MAPPGRRLAAYGEFLRRDDPEHGFINLTGWQASSGVTRKINNQSMVTAQYVFFIGSSTYNSDLTKLTVHSVRLSVGWSPQPTIR